MEMDKNPDVYGECMLKYVGPSRYDFLGMTGRGDAYETQD